MKTLIAYDAREGSARAVAKKIKTYLGGNVETANLKKETPLLDDYQRVIIGGSVVAGQMRESVTEYCQNHLSDLQTKELGLFICCRESGKAARKHLRQAYPESLLRNAKVTASFGNILGQERMSFLDTMITGVYIQQPENEAKAVEEFSRRMDRVFYPLLFLV